MTEVQVGMDEMLERVARFRELHPSKQAFVDTRIPEHVRDIYNVIGRGVTEDPDLKPAITRGRGLQRHLRRGRSRQGRGPPLAFHRRGVHPAQRAMVGLLGDEGENEVILDTFDCVSVPWG